MANIKTTQRIGKVSSKRRRPDGARSRGLAKNFLFVAIVSIWSYWIFFCQPVQNKYEVTTTTERITTTAASKPTDNTHKKESWASKMEVKTTEIPDNATNPPTDSDTEEQEDGNGEDDIDFDDEESEGDDDADGKASIAKDKETVAVNTRDEETEKKDSSHNDLGEIQPVKIIDSNVIPADERFQKHLYMFIHIGKAGGTTLQSNIRTICLRNYVEQNLYWQRRAHKDRVGTIKCLRYLQRQADPSIYNPTTEMVISNDRVVGYLHMNYLSYWWNANDDGEAIDRNKKEGNIQDEISSIIDSGKAYSKDITVFQNPTISDKKDDGMTKSTAFLVPIRDPIDRLVSAFNYHHPHNKRNKNCDDLDLTRFNDWATHSFYCECFDTVNDLVNVFLQDGGSNKHVANFATPTEKISCLKIADGVLMGNSRYKHSSDDQPNNTSQEGLEVYQNYDLELVRKKKNIFHIGHITMNYGYYYRRAFLKYPEKDIVAIRTDHMWEDLQRLEHLLGGTAPVKGEASGHVSVTHGSQKYVASEKITDPKELHGICCVIPSEAKIYMELIERAINLAEEQKKESIAAFQERCNLELCDR